MNNTKVLIHEQIGKLDATKNSFIDVSDGIAVSRNETAVIENNAGSCDEARKQINDVVSNLSAISEEMQPQPSRRQHLCRSLQQPLICLQKRRMVL